MQLRLCVLVAFVAVLASADLTAPAQERVASFVARKGDDRRVCLACVLVTGLLSQRALQTGQTPYEVFDKFCHDSKNPIGKVVCDVLKFVMELENLKKLDAHIPPEQSCQSIKLCPNPAVCTLFPHWPPQSGVENATPRLTSSSPGVGGIPSDDGFWAEFYDLLEFLLDAGGVKVNAKKVFDDHLPINTPGFDEDGDFFSVSGRSLRGIDWRGRDCNDKDAAIYPGRRVVSGDMEADSDCNKIFGKDPTTGASYEDMLCSKTPARGIAVLGDSATAHFRIPPHLLNATTAFEDDTWSGALELLLNEADHPQCSAYTAFENQTTCPPNYGPGVIRSVYSALRKRNLCINEDFQNIGVNGARSTNLNGHPQLYSLQRNQSYDKPLITFLALIGNDVCNGHPDTVASMTTVPEFRQNILGILTYLDTILPKGSTVVTSPLADGLLLHEIMHAAIHPVGVSYEQLYDFLICSGASPCTGWMSSNATLRNITQERANALSAVLPEIAKNNTFKNFDVQCLPTGIMKQAVAKWDAAGRAATELIEPTDGFHPSQSAMVLIADFISNWLVEKGIAGPVNPNNAEIQKIFGL